MPYLSSTVTSPSSPTHNQIQKQTLSLNEGLTLIIAAIAALGSILSGYTAFRALRNSNSNSKNIALWKSLYPNVYEIIDQLISQAPDEHAKKKLLDYKRNFDQQLNQLKNRSKASKEAREWLLNNREKLADEAVAYALK
ncbi:hypothetical protein [Nostoc sp.]|uniref:hypothetical protein n=1 Tax=Nostoc sp. TaxID=1180 RepID=UPI002FFCD988